MNIVFESYSDELVTSKNDIDKWINDIMALWSVIIMWYNICDDESDIQLKI